MLKILRIGVSEMPLKYASAEPSPGWKRYGIEMSWIVYSPHDIPPPKGEIAFYPVCSKSKLNYLHDAVHIARRLQHENSFDLIMADDPMGSGLIGYRLKRELGLPLLIKCHTQYFGHPHWIFERFYYPYYFVLAKFLLPRADRIQAVSQSIKRSLISLGISPSKIEVCPTPVWTTFFNPSGGDPRRFLNQKILFVGQLIPQKGLFTLVDAIRLLVREGGNPLLQIVGDGPLKRMLERRVKHLGLRERVTFFGHVPNNELLALYRQCSLFVLPSLYEGFPKVLIEAQLCGAPVVATRVGGSPEAVRENETALLVPSHSAKALGQAIKKLIDQPELARRMGENAAMFAAEKWEVGQMISTTAAFWHRAASQIHYSAMSV